MKRGDVVIVSLAGDYGKPRPAVVVQADRYLNLDSVTVVPLTSYVPKHAPLRIELDPTPENGLIVKSQAMIDKMATVPRAKTGNSIGHVSDEDMASVDRALAAFLGFA
jgi:mRNA interferase MazF